MSSIREKHFGAFLDANFPDLSKKMMVMASGLFEESKATGSSTKFNFSMDIFEKKGEMLITTKFTGKTSPKQKTAVIVLRDNGQLEFAGDSPTEGAEPEDNSEFGDEDPDEDPEFDGLEEYNKNHVSPGPKLVVPNSDTEGNTAVVG